MAAAVPPEQLVAYESTKVLVTLTCLASMHVARQQQQRRPPPKEEAGGQAAAPDFLEPDESADEDARPPDSFEGRVASTCRLFLVSGGLASACGFILALMPEPGSRRLVDSFILLPMLVLVQVSCWACVNLALVFLFPSRNAWPSTMPCCPPRPASSAFEGPAPEAPASLPPPWDLGYRGGLAYCLLCCGYIAFVDRSFDVAIYLASPGGVLLLLACLALSLHHNHNHSIRLGALLFAVGLITHITGLAQEIYYDHSCSSASPECPYPPWLGGDAVYHIFQSAGYALCAWGTRIVLSSGGGAGDVASLVHNVERCDSGDLPGAGLRKEPG